MPEEMRRASETPVAERMASIRSTARAEAETTLRGVGFVADAMGEWHGALTPGDGAFPARVVLPAGFPDELPRVFVDRTSLARRIAHVEQSGKVCIVPDSGVLLDGSRPGSLVLEALARAARTVSDGLLGRTDEDLRREFLAYWGDAGPTVLSICDPNGPARPVARVKTGGFGGLAAGTHLLADSLDSAERWARAVVTSVKSAGTAFLLPLVTALDPPNFEDVLTTRGVLSVFNTFAAPEALTAFREWLATTKLPVTVVLSLPEPLDGEGRPLVAVSLPAPTGEAAKRADAGFRRGATPINRSLAFSSQQPARRITPLRLDRSFLAARGGASEQLATRAVTLVGAGAVGSEIAQHLAALGVGRLHIVDADDLEPANVHRHALGVTHVALPKAEALCAELSRRFPHLDFDPVLQRVEDVVLTRSALLTDVDLLVFATGEETLERRLNGLLGASVARVHAWVEPLGIAGHALGFQPAALGSGTRGCYECLFETRDSVGLVNRAALTAPGQEIRRSLGGCAGTFSPFSALDARRTALEAAELAGRLLRGMVDEGLLITWRGDRTDFEAAGYRLSTRARIIAPGARVMLDGRQFGRAGCSVCGAAASGDRPPTDEEAS